MNRTEKNFNRLTRQNTATNFSQVLVEKKTTRRPKGYDTIKKRYDVTQQGESAYEEIGILNSRTPLENQLLKAQEEYGDNYDDMTEKEEVDGTADEKDENGLRYRKFRLNK